MYVSRIFPCFLFHNKNVTKRKIHHDVRLTDLFIWISESCLLNKLIELADDYYQQLTHTDVLTSKNQS